MISFDLVHATRVDENGRESIDISFNSISSAPEPASHRRRPAHRASVMWRAQAGDSFFAKRRDFPEILAPTIEHPGSRRSIGNGSFLQHEETWLPESFTDSPLPLAYDPPLLDYLLSLLSFNMNSMKLIPLHS